MNNKKVIALKFLIVLIFLFVGLYLRTQVPHNTMTANTVAFYFSRAEYLEQTGAYLKEDNTTFAGYSYRENYPPFPAYLSVPTYKVVKIFGVNFNDYISYFPVLLYLVIFFAGFFAVKTLFNLDSAMFFSILFAITPVAIRVTNKNYYTEEALGILFMICSVYFVCKTKKFDFNFAMATFFLALLALTWQVFLLVFFAIGLLAFFSFRNKRIMLAHYCLIILPLILGHIASVYIIGIDYSPISMIEESLITLQEGHEEYFKVAFNRRDLETPGYQNIKNEFGVFTSIMVLAGFAALSFNFKEQKNRFLLFLGAIAGAAFLNSTKFRYFAAGPLLIIGALGSDSLINFFSMKKWHKIVIGLGIGMLLLMFSFKELAAPSCDVSIDAPEDIRAGEYYQVVLTVRNKGFGPECSNQSGSFGGLHVEFGNATILNYSISPEQSKLIKYRVQYNDFNWFESVIDCLRPQEEVNVTAWIMPKSNNVKVNYRCWLPRKYCTEEAPVDLRPEYRMDWRNEKCISRHPSKGDICDVKVFAGYINRTDFYCLSKMLR